MRTQFMNYFECWDYWTYWNGVLNSTYWKDKIIDNIEKYFNTRVRIEIIETIETDFNNYSLLNYIPKD